MRTLPQIPTLPPFNLCFLRLYRILSSFLHTLSITTCLSSLPVMKNCFVGDQILGLNRNLCAKGPCSDLIVIKGVYARDVVSCISHVQVCCTYRRCCFDWSEALCTSLRRIREVWVDVLHVVSMFSTAAPHWKTLPPSLFSSE